MSCDCSSNSHMLLLQGTNVLLNSKAIVTNVAHLRTISNIELPASSIVTLLTMKIGKHITNVPLIYEVENNEILFVQNPQVTMLSNAH